MKLCESRPHIITKKYWQEEVHVGHKVSFDTIMADGWLTIVKLEFFDETAFANWARRMLRSKSLASLLWTRLQRGKCCCRTVLQLTQWFQGIDRWYHFAASHWCQSRKQSCKSCSLSRPALLCLNELRKSEKPRGHLNLFLVRFHRRDRLFRVE